LGPGLGLGLGLGLETVANLCALKEPVRAVKERAPPSTGRRVLRSVTW
jgi:hypothetical protein